MPWGTANLRVPSAVAAAVRHRHRRWKVVPQEWWIWHCNGYNLCMLWRRSPMQLGMVVLFKAACQKPDVRMSWLLNVAHVDVLCRYGFWSWFAKPFGILRRGVKTLCSGVFKRKQVLGRNGGPSKGTSSAKMHGLPFWELANKDWTAVKKNLWKRWTVLIWPWWILVWFKGVKFWEFYNLFLGCDAIASDLLFHSPCCSGPNAKCAVKSAAVKSFFVHMYWSAGETMTVMKLIRNQNPNPDQNGSNIFCTCFNLWSKLFQKPNWTVCNIYQRHT